MSGDNKEQEVVELKQDEVRIGGKTFVMKPLVGLKAIKTVPKFLSMLSRAMLTAMKGGISIDKLLLSDDDSVLDADNFTPMLFGAASIILDQLTKDWDVFAFEILPMIIGADKRNDLDFLLNNGTTSEFTVAIWKAIKFHAPTVLGEDTINALKKSTAAEEQSADQDPQEVGQEAQISD